MVGRKLKAHLIRQCADQVHSRFNAVLIRYLKLQVDASLVFYPRVVSSVAARG